MARTEEGEEAEEEDPCFPEQSMETDPKLNHAERGVQVTHEGKDNWGEPYWHDRWHPQAHQPGNVSDACPFAYVDVSDEMALSDLHMKNSDNLEAKNVFTRNDYDITLFSNRGLGCAQLVVYQRRRALLDVRTADSLCILRVVMGNQLIGFLLWNAYGSGWLIPYCVMMATRHGNGCLQRDPDNDCWCTRRYVPDNELPHDVLEFQNTHPMIDLVELVYWGSFGVTYKSKQHFKKVIYASTHEEIVIQPTSHDLEIDVEYVY